MPGYDIRFIDSGDDVRHSAGLEAKGDDFGGDPLAVTTSPISLGEIVNQLVVGLSPSPLKFSCLTLSAFGTYPAGQCSLEAQG